MEVVVKLCLPIWRFFLYTKVLSRDGLEVGHTQTGTRRYAMGLAEWEVMRERNANGEINKVYV